MKFRNVLLPIRLKGNRVKNLKVQTAQEWGIIMERKSTVLVKIALLLFLVVALLFVTMRIQVTAQENQGSDRLLEFRTAPRYISYDLVALDNMDVSLVPVRKESSLSVVDTRTNRNPWRISVRVVEELHNEGADHTLLAAFVYHTRGQRFVLDYIGTPIHFQTTSVDYLVITDMWSGHNGLQIELPAGTTIHPGGYHGIVEFTLEDVPVE